MPPPAPRPAAAAPLDVLIIGAGLSGIGAACYLQRDQPGRRYAILEARADLGGTWDLFRYPGIRSDSDLYTFGYEFRPWREEDSIASGAKILAYLRETAAEHDVERHIRYRSRARAASWSRADARWTVEVEDTETGALSQVTARWLFCATGYFRYDEGFTPRFEGRERFAGPVIHPQHWPAGLDYAGRRVVVIGSGATAVTLLPALAETAGHVTMVQRTPSYVMPVRRADTWAPRLCALVGEERAYALTRRKNIARQQATWWFCQRHPTAARRVIRHFNVKFLPPGYPVDEHFSPPYDPWDQRLCAAPNADLFHVIGEGRASVVTGRIAAFTEDGVRLESGRVIPADIIVTATGLRVQAMGGLAISVDGQPVSLPGTVAYKGMMLSGVPNLAYAVGYTNASWTLKVGLLCEHFCRLLGRMDELGAAAVTPVVAGPGMATRPFLNLGAGYIQRAVGSLPRQGDRAPWLTSLNYGGDVRLLRHQPVDDPELHFTTAPAAP